MKKIKPLFFVVGIFAFLMIFLFGRKAYGNMTDLADMTDIAIESSETAEEIIEAVDKKMSEALASDRYREMSLSERRELASGILLQLEQDGYITGLSYNEDSFMYSFEYIDGTLGGWSIKDFSAQDGLLPMN